MKSLCIKTNNTNTLEYLLNELNYIDLNDICYSTNEFKHYKNIIIHYSGKDTDAFINKICSILSLYVIDEVETELLNRILIQNYFYFDANERNSILDICYDITAEDFTEIFDKKYNSLFQSFFNFLSNNKSIILNGFINFRLKEYTNILDDIVCEAVNNFIIEKEYLEFISLLKLYINTQSNHCNIVHIIYSNSESILLDEDKNIIDIQSNTLNAKFLSDISFSSNDYTLNSLLTLLPNNIYIHLADNYIDEFINTLQLIFEKRIHLCTDCNICRIYKKSCQRFWV